MKQTRQIVTVYNPPAAGVPYSVEVVNPSPEVITQLLVEVHASTFLGDARQDLLWEWQVDAVMNLDATQSPDPVPVTATYLPMNVSRISQEYHSNNDRK